VRTSLLCARASALEGLAGAPRHTTALRQVEGVVAFDLNLVGWWNLARSADSGAGQSKPYFFVTDARHDPNVIRKQRRVVGGVQFGFIHEGREVCALRRSPALRQLTRSELRSSSSL
jgi:hypothetical protein